MTNDCVSITKTLDDGSKIYDREAKSKVSAKTSKCHKNNSYIFLHNNNCKTPYIYIYIDLLSINFNLLSVL